MDRTVRVFASTAFAYCLMTAVLGRPASFPFFLVCLLAGILGANWDRIQAYANR